MDRKMARINQNGNKRTKLIRKCILVFLPLLKLQK